MKTLLEEKLESGVKLIGRAISLAGNGDFVVLETEGLAALTKGAQKDVAVVVPAQEHEKHTKDTAKLLNTVATLATKGDTVDVGGRTVVKGALFGAFAGVCYAPGHSLPPSRVNAADTEGAARLIAVPLLAEELSVLERAGMPRVLARLGQALRFFPFPTWVTGERPPAIRERDIEGSVFAHGMPTAGAFAAAVDNDVAVLKPHKDACALVLDQLRSGRPVVCATPVDPVWCEHALVFSGQEKTPQAITRAAGPDRNEAPGKLGPIGVSFVAITLTTSNSGARGAVQLEDGIGIALSPADARRLCGALETGTPFTLDDPDASPQGRRMKVRLEPQGGAVESARPRAERVFLVAAELMSDGAQLGASITMPALAQFHDDIVRTVDGVVKKLAPKEGTELRMRHQLKKDRKQPRLSVLKTDALSEDLVATVGDAVCALTAPAITGAPVSFELVFIVT